jgi:hypothetical protein
MARRASRSAMGPVALFRHVPQQAAWRPPKQERGPGRGRGSGDCRSASTDGRDHKANAGDFKPSPGSGR